LQSNNAALRVAFAGTPEFAAIAVNAIVDEGFNVVVAYTQPDRHSGRGMKLTASAVKNAALTRGLSVVQPEKLRSAEAQAELAAFTPDVLVVAAYGLILPQAVLNIPRYGCLNIHASLLPRWRGAAPIHRAILAGDNESGVCIMQMEAGLDTGPVLTERRTPITPEDTTGSLHDRLAMLGADAVVEILRAIANGAALNPQVQPEIGVTYAHKISQAEAQIDWANDAEQLMRQVNAFNPAPGAWTGWRGEKLKIWSTKSVAGVVNDMLPGTIMAIESDHLLVRCGANLLAIYEIQRAGSKRMGVQAWLAGGGPSVGERFEMSPSAS
jgi:methionyl-tRNA formyltransferase